jgi:predicted transcriptional regulator
MSVAKEEAKKILDKIPDNATWDDIMYEFYVRQKIESALEDAESGRVVPHEEVEARFQPR